jgi:hypothetical protein
VTSGSPDLVKDSRMEANLESVKTLRYQLSDSTIRIKQGEAENSVLLFSWFQSLIFNMSTTDDWRLDRDGWS